MAWTFLQDNWEAIESKLEAASLLASVVGICTRGFTSLDKVAEINAFTESHSLDSGSKRSVVRSVESITHRCQRLTRDVPLLTAAASL